MTARVLGELRVLETPPQLAQALAELFAAEAGAAIASRGRFFVSLAGGTTPKAAYALLAQPPLRDAVDWTRVHVYFGDERCVPPDNDQSNYKTAHDALLSKVPVPETQIHRMHGEDPPDAAARAYARVLRETLGDAPRFDLIMLGMGPDGHTASLFPGTDPLTDDDAFVRAPFVAKFGTHRLTMTPRVLDAARHVVIATEGVAKAAALHAAREGAYDPVTYPVQIVAPFDGNLTWLVDRAAYGGG